MRRAVWFEGSCPISLSLIKAVGSLQRVTWRKRYRVWIKSVAILRTPKWNQKKRNIVVLKCKKMFLFEKIDKKVRFISLFLGNSYLCPRKTGDSFMWGPKNLSVSSSILFTVFALEMRKRKEYRKHGIKRVCPSQQGLCFRAWPIHAGFTVHCLMSICKYLSLSHKPDYELRGLRPTNSLHCFNYLNTFSFSYSKEKYISGKQR